ncbi:MAG: hypothetical protein U0324_02840 [Polyangiales bacterium]
MKKAATTVEAFRDAVAAIEDELDLAGHVAREAPAGEADAWLRQARVNIGDARPATPRGRGERVSVDVATVWNAPPFGSTETPLAALRSRVAALPGVESVGDASADTQLGAVWGFAVTLRLSQ